jgi:hypothetical protein
MLYQNPCVISLNNKYDKTAGSQRVKSLTRNLE